MIGGNYAEEAVVVSGDSGEGIGKPGKVTRKVGGYWTKAGSLDGLHPKLVSWLLNN